MGLSGPQIGLLMRRCSGAHAALLPRGGTRHAPAFIRAAPASLRAILAMLHLMLGALVSAGIADFGAKLTQDVGEFAIPRHVAGRHSADLRAIHVQCDAARHNLHVLLLHAGSFAIVAL